MNPRRAFGVLRYIFARRAKMFDRYTENARRTIFFARYEALEAGRDAIEPEHIALGLLRDQWLVATALNGHDVRALRGALLSTLTPGEKRTEDRDVPLNGEAKRVLAYAADAADTLFDSHIGNEHLLLGAVRQTGSAVARVLTQEGIEVEDLRKRVKRVPREVRKANGGDQAARWRAAGIPEGYSGPTLLYNAASETAVLEVHAAGETFRPARLLMRPKGAAAYEPIGNPGDEVSYESPVTCESLPVVVFNSMNYGKAGGDWLGVYRFDLPTREMSLCLSKDNFVVPAPYTAGWIAKILSLSNDANHAYVKTGLKRPPEQEGETVKVYLDYYVARLNLKTREMELVSRLENTSF
jgi:hypothetical protein